jgi:signal peptidase I
MANPINDPSQPPNPLAPNPTPKPSSSRKKVVLAGLLSLVFPGMGQLYNRQPGKGFGFSLISFSLAMTMVKTRLLFTFSTMAIIIIALLLWKIFVAPEAAWTAAIRKTPESPIPLPWLIYPLLAIFFFVAAVFPSPDKLRSETGFAAFKISSTSMCPTLCLGERVVADTHSYKSGPPQRGDLILMKHASSDALFVKRVIALPGDTVAPGFGGAILVNGQPFNPPVPCAPIEWQKKDSADYAAFQLVSVPDGSFFVVGDNLTNSYDSRISDFGAVKQDMVRGKLLYIYWSPVKSRLGCYLR